MKICVSLISDCVFFFFLCSVCCLAVLNFFVAPPFSIVISIAAALFFAAVYSKSRLKKHGRGLMKKSDLLEKNKMLTQFNFATKNQVYDFFEIVIKKQGYIPERVKGGISVAKQNKVIFPFFGFLEPNKALIVRVFNSIKDGEVGVILSESFSKDLTDFAARFNQRIVLVDGEKLFQYLKKINSLPPEKYSFSQPKPNKKAVLLSLFERKKAKSFFAFGSLFLAYSYLVPLKLYYIVCGCIFLIAAVFCFAFGKRRRD